MSDTGRDSMLWEAIGGDPEELVVDGEDTNPDEEYVTREEFERLEKTVRWLVRVVNNAKGEEFAGLTTLEKYTRMVENGEEDALSASDVRAVVIHSNWDALASRLPNGNLGISTRKSSTKKHGPSEFTVDLQNLTGEDLHRPQVYRAMKRTAELSGGVAEPDEYGRMHVVGGLYEYHERTSPDNTDHASFKVLIQS